MSGMKFVLVVLVALLVVPVAFSSTRPRVYLSSSHPLVVHGSGFKHGERVRLTISRGELLLHRSVEAGSDGAFTARFTRSIPAGCAATFVRAVGSAGSTAVYKPIPSDCAPPADPTK